MALSRHVAMDCEMVGASTGENLAARVSIVNEYEQVILDKYIKPSKPIGDYRTNTSGIHPSHLQNGESLSKVSSEVARIISGRILIGHSLKADLDVLGLTHSESMMRDLALYKPFRQRNGGQPASLKFLAKELLGKNIQIGSGHCSVEDAKTAMAIYLKEANNWHLH